ncbi:MAG: hypothetical protein ABI858_05195 [Pseudoxanthomonas sp.]
MLDLQTLHRRASRVLPEVVKTSGLFEHPMEQNQLAALLFPLRRKSSGSIRFRLSAGTVEAMKIRPMAYLQQATQARAALGRQQHPFVYRAWRMACLPRHWVESVAASPDSLQTSSVDAYFTTKTDDKALVVIVPDKSIALYFWKD